MAIKEREELWIVLYVSDVCMYVCFYGNMESK